MSILDGATVAIPSIPTRGKMLFRAVQSVLQQSRPVEALAISVDHHRLGAWANRNIALAMVRTKWTLFLDDDDQLGPYHYEKLAAMAERERADLVFPWFDVVGGHDPFPMHEGKRWDIGPDNLEAIRQFPITVLVRTEAVLRVGGFEEPTEGQVWEGQRAGEDLHMWIKLVRAGYKIVHLPERTWTWNHHGGNTSGRADQW